MYEGAVHSADTINHINAASAVLIYGTTASLVAPLFDRFSFPKPLQDEQAAQECLSSSDERETAVYANRQTVVLR